jgi:HPt (histidine-containing phosphotransfer) domain-containing protein
MSSENKAALCEEAAVRLNKAEILARLDGDWQLLAELCDLALAETPGMIEALSAAIERQDADAVHRAAHRLKGALSVLGDGPHIAAAVALEEMGRNRELARADDTFDRLKRLLGEFGVAVAALGKEAYARAGG